MSTRAGALQAFIAQAGWADAMQEPLAGDASFRRYIRLRKASSTAMLMDAPPPAEDVHPYLAVARHLYANGYGAPDVLAADEAHGFVLSEDLGDALFTRVIAGGEAEAPLYSAAVDVLIRWSHDRRMRKNSSLALHDYDAEVYLREVSLFADWFLPQALGEALREEYLALWRSALSRAPLACEIFVHRDYHADNLLWLGARGVGQLDFQDALWGHAAYDLVSLLEDARRDVDPAIAAAEIKRYVSETNANPDAFAASYALLAAQRNSKIVGIFARLAKRDGKPHYLRYLPRVWAHLERDLAHPLLADIRTWMDRYVPKELRV